MRLEIAGLRGCVCPGGRGADQRHVDRLEKLGIGYWAQDERRMVPLGFGLQHRIVEATRDDRRHIRMIGAASEDQVEAIVEAEAKVGDEDVRWVQRDEVLRFVESSRVFDAVSSRFKQPHGGSAVCWTGIDDQNRAGNRHIVLGVTQVCACQTPIAVL